MQKTRKDLHDERAINKIIKNYEYIIRIIINKYNIQSKDMDDVLQEGRLGLLKAIEAYDEHKGSKFKSFASLCIERQILTFLRNNNRKKNSINKHCYPIEYYMVGVEGCKNFNSGNSVEEYVLTKLYLNNACVEAYKQMNNLEKNIFSNYIYGYSASELMEMYSLSKKQIYMIVAKCKRILNKMINDKKY